jgi:hypothetical protein
VARYVLLHSPLVGPTTWKWVAEELRTEVDDVVVPTVAAATLSAGWRAVASEFADQVPDTPGMVFVAHSGAGLLLPSIADRARAVDASLVFVDAGIPSASVPTPLVPDEMLQELTRIAENGVLPPWSDWFGPDVMKELIPDLEMRRLVTSDLPRLPLSYFSDAVLPVRPWPAAGNGYILLSEAYVDEASEAARRGWDVVELIGRHLDIVSKAHEVADAVRHLAVKVKDHKSNLLS